MTTIVKNGRYLYLPEGFTELPTTVVEALRVGKAILMEEGRWIQDELFTNPRPEEDPSTPYCNGWGACAVGAVHMCTVGLIEGLPSKDEGDHAHGYVDGVEVCLTPPSWQEALMLSSWPGTAICTDATNLLDDAAAAITDGEYTAIVEFNDHDGRTHEQVIEAFDNAIQEAEAEAQEVSSQ